MQDTPRKVFPVASTSTVERIQPRASFVPCRTVERYPRRIRNRRMDVFERQIPHGIFNFRRTKKIRLPNRVARPPRATVFVPRRFYEIFAVRSTECTADVRAERTLGRFLPPERFHGEKFKDPVIRVFSSKFQTSTSTTGKENSSLFRRNENERRSIIETS